MDKNIITLNDMQPMDAGRDLSVYKLFPEYDTHPPSAILQDDVHVCIVLEVVMKADDVPVAQVPVDLDLAGDLFKRKTKNTLVEGLDKKNLLRISLVSSREYISLIKCKSHARTINNKGQK